MSCDCGCGCARLVLKFARAHPVAVQVRHARAESVSISHMIPPTLLVDKHPARDMRLFVGLRGKHRDGSLAEVLGCVLTIRIVFAMTLRSPFTIGDEDHIRIHLSRRQLGTFRRPHTHRTSRRLPNRASARLRILLS
jgi:hypothetical protein